MPQPIPGTDPPQPPQTVGWKLNHICFRIRDPEATTHFYRDILGMRSIFTVDCGSFTILYFGYPEQVGVHETGVQMLNARHCREGLLEFIHVHDGGDLTTRNIASNGFSHMGVSVPNYEEALKRLKDAGVKFLKDRGEDITISVYGLPADTPQPLDEDFVKVIRNFAFVEDPDGYCIEVMGQH